MSDKEDVRKKKRLERQAFKVGIKCFKSFYFFFKTFWPQMSGDKYIDAPHIEYICDTLQYWGMKVVKGELCMETLIINVPPGSSKSTIATIAFPMWIWLHGPHLASTNVSYSDTLSARHAKKARSITDSEKWHLLFDNIFTMKHGKQFEIVSQNKKAIENNFKGERFNTSTDGTITGMHADFIIKDDMQNPKEAKSDTIRASVNEWDEETLTSRHKNEMCYLDIIIAQRLHEMDLTGYTRNKAISITVVCLPSEITNASKVLPPEAESLYTDGLLDINRRPKFVLEQLKAKSGSSAYTCQYLQAPFNLEEQDITPSMFEIIESYRDDIIWDLWIDGAYTEKTENDPSGIDVIAKVGNNVVVKESYDLYKKLPDLLAFIVELEKNGVFNKDKSRIFIEPKASGLSLADYIEFDTEYNFVRIGEHRKQESRMVQGGHKARHETIKPKAESHRIKLVKGTWNESFITQICGFPKAAHDEHVDNLGYAINHYYFGESMFIEQYALDRLEKKVTGAINIKITSQIQRNRISASYEENDSGDVQLFDTPNKLYKYRYICILALKGEGDRGGNTSIVVIDRMTLTVPAMFVSNTINPKKAGLKALEMAQMFDTAKLVVAVRKDSGHIKNEEYDLSHIAIQEAKNVSYNNIYFRITQNRIKKTREREYGFEVNQSTSREVYYNMKDMCETARVKELPLDIFEEIKMLERKKDTGEIGAKEGYQTNAAMAYSVGLKIHEEMYDKPKVKKSEKW